MLVAHPALGTSGQSHRCRRSCCNDTVLRIATPQPTFRLGAATCKSISCPARSTRESRTLTAIISYRPRGFAAASKKRFAGFQFPVSRGGAQWRDEGRDAQHRAVPRSCKRRVPLTPSPFFEALVASLSPALQSRHSLLNRYGASAVYFTVWWIERWPR